MLICVFCGLVYLAKVICTAPVTLYNVQRGRNRKMSTIHDFITDEHADLACITETCLEEMEGVHLLAVYTPGLLVQH